MFVTFLKKPTHPPEPRIYIPLFLFLSSISCSYKKEKKKNINNILFFKKNAYLENLLFQILQSQREKKRKRKGKKGKEKEKKRKKKRKRKRVREEKSESKRVKVRE